MAGRRLKSLMSHVIPHKSEASPTATDVTTDDKKLPDYDDLPKFNNMPGCAWTVWGPEDQLGTINLLTDKLVKRTAEEEIKSGKAISLNWPLNFPEKPMFNRKSPEVLMKYRVRDPPVPTVRDDEIHINTQSGTQWDGLRHFGIIEHGVFYNNTPAESLPTGIIPISNPVDIDPNLKNIGIQNWAEHGICGRGVFLDLVRHESKGGTATLPYDPWTTHAVTVADLESCAKDQGVTFRRGDILILRVGFIQKYMVASKEDRDGLASKPETFAGIEQSEEMKRFLWNNHFAAIASDQPALERWPAPEGMPHMHQTLLGLWGMPIGEFFDVEKLSAHCNETGRYTFFFSSWPLHIIGGCASPPNAAAYF